ncbi:Persistence and stress-resistance antitoxin PasI [Ephemeroptericola cinctiostellae]|uniref:UPF0125 protein DTO96_101433 n=1 Tax=Ephemeroptericola cinctiostellae TaxID=2268024 RepID=A0A345DBG4_9BURK|nr:RnfH family protein [Ephemeroptericola cinctiostellae]AXF85702.1 Persistence and stress-resistance antitoxin PasI [Ephemeroptericola cinctiostellae]
MHADIRVSVVYMAENGTLFNINVVVSETATVRDAILASGFLNQHPDMPIETLHLGIYSLRATPDDRLHDKDRIEIYRPLLIDPMARRRKVVDEKRDPAKWRRER